MDDVHTPYPVHGMDEALGLPDTRLGLATLAGGLLGAGVAFFQFWTHVVDWPLVIGGKSPLALPAQVPVSFELTVLFAAFATVGTFLARRRLFPRIAVAAVAAGSGRHRRPLRRPRRRARRRLLARRVSASCRELGPVTVEGWRVM